MINPGDFIYFNNNSGKKEQKSFMRPFLGEKNFSTHKGMIEFPEDMDYGMRLETNIGEPFTVLRPTHVDYMMKVKRAGTIIYPKEAGMIILELGVEPGQRVVECGTGSGAFTILLSRMVGSEGHVYTFEREESRSKTAQKNVEKLGFMDRVDFFVFDVAESADGFGVTDADSVFIDVPAPWTLVKAAHDALKPGGHIGSLSPCIEQVQGMVDKMRKIGFDRIRTMELLSRNIQVEPNKTRPFSRMIGHTAYLTFAEKVNEPEEKSE